MFAVYRRSSLIFGSWRRALAAAGLSEDLASSRRAKSRHSHLPIHFENLPDAHGKFRRVGFLGFSPKTPEEVAEINELTQLLYRSLKDLPVFERSIADRVVQVLLEQSNVADLHDAIVIAANSGQHLSSNFMSDAKEIFAKVIAKF